MLKKSNKFNFQLINEYIGFEIKQEFVVGFGLDYNQRFRNLKDDIYFKIYMSLCTLPRFGT